MTVEQIIEAKIRDSLSPAHLQVINDSHKHDVPPGSESHFTLVIVSDRFEGETRLRRHRTVNKILEKELKEEIHALSLKAFTATEWDLIDGQVVDTPPCLGGSKSDI